MLMDHVNVISKLGIQSALKLLIAVLIMRTICYLRISSTEEIMSIEIYFRRHVNDFIHCFIYG